MSQVRVRSYCHGLGDCHLIRVAKPTGGALWMLIDCGIHSSAKGGTARVAAVIADIRTLTTHLDIVVATHEHWDHISGFVNPGFDGFTVGEVWLAWTENPADKQAQALDKFKGEALTALTEASARAALAADDPASNALEQGLQALLGFEFGLTGEKSRSARDAVVALAPANVRYLDPGATVPLTKGLGVTAYVLGPPRDPQALGVRDGPNSYGIADSLNASFALGEGTMDVDDDPGAPFDETEGVQMSALPTTGKHAAFLRDHYTGPAVSLPEGKPDTPQPDQQWRRIDGDWLGAAATLALQLDDRTNNTSLVLALALAEGDVLLFAADAQLGNWSTWGAVKFPDGTTGPDLLARTVFYKAGHHGSANATAKAGGLEAMTHPALQTFVPTDEVMAKKVGWGAIPAPGLMTRLGEKGAVVRSDDVGGKLFVEYDFGGVPAPKRRTRTSKPVA